MPHTEQLERLQAEVADLESRVTVLEAAAGPVQLLRLRDDLHALSLRVAVLDALGVKNALEQVEQRLQAVGIQLAEVRHGQAGTARTIERCFDWAIKIGVGLGLAYLSLKN